MVTETMDRGCAIDIFYFDLEKAFNTVPHEQLVAKLKQHAVILQNNKLDNQLFKWKKTTCSD